jgi:hypothetical protein
MGKVVPSDGHDLSAKLLSSNVTVPTLELLTL